MTEDNFLSISNLKKESHNSVLVRNIFVTKGYKKFDGKRIKGDLCYDAYYKEFVEDNSLKYTIYLYCYDLKEIVPDPDLLEFSFETQIESKRGVLGIESIQWDFTNCNNVPETIDFFEQRIEETWKIFGGNPFPC